MDSVTIISRYDYDARHPAGTSLNDIVQVISTVNSAVVSPGTPVTLLSQGQGTPYSAEIWRVQGLKLTVSPAQAGPQQLRVRYHQTNGEVYEAETPLLTVLP